MRPHLIELYFKIVARCSKLYFLGWHWRPVSHAGGAWHGQFETRWCLEQRRERSCVWDLYHQCSSLIIIYHDLSLCIIYRDLSWLVIIYHRSTSPWMFCRLWMLSGGDMKQFSPASDSTIIETPSFYDCRWNWSWIRHVFRLQFHISSIEIFQSLNLDLQPWELFYIGGHCQTTYGAQRKFSSWQLHVTRT